MSSQITLRVLDGADRGRVFSELRPPVTIGREEGNDVQLNDERVSRFHLKLQVDGDQVVLTDLDSTNGTKVNGEDVKLRLVHIGDIISLGRSVLVYGSREEIAKNLARKRPHDSGEQTGDPSGSSRSNSDQMGFNLSGDAEGLQVQLYRLDPPSLPARLSPGQAAQFAEVLDYFHLRLRELIKAVENDPKSSRVVLSLEHWQEIIDMQSRLAEYLRRITDPSAGEH